MKVIIDGQEKELQSRFELLAEGEYEAEIIEVKVECDVQTKYGTCDQLKVTYEIEDGVSAFEKKDRIIYSESVGSRWGMFVRALYQGELPEQVDTDTWIGRKGIIKIKHNKVETGKVYDNIVAWDFDAIVQDTDGETEREEDTIIWDEDI